MTLNFENICVSIQDATILKNLNLHMGKGEIHAIMGPNGTGKSTLAKTAAGHPSYELTSGRILLENEDISECDINERSHKGLFVGFQYPLEIHGVSNFQFLFTCYNAKQKALQQPLLAKSDFRNLLQGKLQEMEMDPSFLDRGLNEGFSGGEKKRNEILQLLVLNPKVAILDETDSGLDIDAMKVVARGIKNFFNEDKSLLLITHYQRLLNFVQPDFVHVMMDGHIVRTGDFSLAKELEEKGYDFIANKETV